MDPYDASHVFLRWLNASCTHRTGTARCLIASACRSLTAFIPVCFNLAFSPKSRHCSTCGTRTSGWLRMLLIQRAPVQSSSPTSTQAMQGPGDTAPSPRRRVCPAGGVASGRIVERGNSWGVRTSLKTHATLVKQYPAHDRNSIGLATSSGRFCQGNWE